LQENASRPGAADAAPGREAFLLAEMGDGAQKLCNRQRNRRIDLHEIIVLERSGTFQHYFVQGGFQ